MVARRANSSHGDHDKLRDLVRARVDALRRMEGRTGNLPLRDYYLCQEGILEEVLRRAQEGLNDESLVAWVDCCIRESRLYQGLTTDRGLKSFYGLRIRILRSFLVLARRRFNPRRWFRRRKPRRSPSP
jgi:hypothetical protein